MLMLVKIVKLPMDLLNSSFLKVFTPTFSFLRLRLGFSVWTLLMSRARQVFVVGRQSCTSHDVQQHPGPWPTSSWLGWTNLSSDLVKCPLKVGMRATGVMRKPYWWFHEIKGPYLLTCPELGILKFATKFSNLLLWLSFDIISFQFWICICFICKSGMECSNILCSF